MIVFPEEMLNAAHNIKWLRAENKLTQAEMAKLLKITPVSLRRIERGDFPERLRVMVPFRISVQFDIRPADLFSKKLG